MRNVTFQSLVEQVRAECRLSTNSSRGIDNRAYIEQLVKRCYEELYDEYDWQNLRIERSVDMQAGQRYYDFPSDLNIEFLQQSWVQHDNARFPLTQGIDPTHYNAMDSETDERASHPLKWDWHRPDDGGDQFEVWPIPSTDSSDDSAVKVWWRGRKAYTQLVNLADRCLIDDKLVVLSASAEILSDAKSAGAELKLKKFGTRLSKLRARYESKRIVKYGAVNPDYISRKPYLRVAHHE